MEQCDKWLFGGVNGGLVLKVKGSVVEVNCGVVGVSVCFVG